MPTAADPARWIHTRLAALGYHVRQTAVEREGPTGRVLAVETDRGRVYAKLCAPGFAHEPPLTAALAAWFPDDVPAVLAVDAAQRRLLLADASPTVKALTEADGSFDRWAVMLRRFAQMQQAAVPHVDELLALGVPDRRPAALAAAYPVLLADPGPLMVGHPEGVSRPDLARLQALAPEVTALARGLTVCDIPCTLHHDDFHAGNAGCRQDDIRFFDWGESCIAHPFFSLLITLRYAKFLFDADEAVLTALRDAYLGAWTAYAPLERLIALLPVTHRFAALCRTLTWRDVVAGTAPEYRADIAEAVPYWLLTFLNDTPLG